MARHWNLRCWRRHCGGRQAGQSGQTSSPPWRRECEATRAKKVPLSFTQNSNASNKAREAREELKRAIPSLESFYKPYDQMLQALVHPAFQWSAATHKA